MFDLLPRLKNRPKQHIFFQPTTNTLRQYPENYLLAYKDQYNGWCMSPDLAAKRELVVNLTIALLDHENKYQKDGFKILDAIPDYKLSIA